MKIIRLVIVVTMTPIAAAHAQPAGAPVIVTPQTSQNAEMLRSLEEQKQRYLLRQECIKTNESAYRLHTASADVISIRNNRKAIDYELSMNASRRAQFPGGYDQVLAEAVARYRAAGGTARAAADVVPSPDPCPLPIRISPERLTPEQRGLKPPVSQSRSMPAQ
jgi:hypothetical protein